ncbi:MAG: DNA adenine methylase [Acidobacteria bacterium]|nr:DNA adenine methylase [Acidobacteriota bacterium]
MKVSHPVLKYYGSKFRIAKWIIDHFPKHRHYIEPFGGAASVLLVKEPSKLETYNDLNGDLVNFFQILRGRPAELVEKIKLTPWAREEFEGCLTNAGDQLERARRLFCRLWMSYQASMNLSKGNFRRHTQGRRSVLNDIKPENLFHASERFLKVQIESRDAFRLMRELDAPDALFYLDPPYVLSTRTTKKGYSHEMTNGDHKHFAEIVRDLKGFVVLSGYPSKIYEELFEAHGWERYDKETMTIGNTKRIESIWLSPATMKMLKSA